jgi:GNAT superfamily N-acetyltransferase
MAPHHHYLSPRQFLPERYTFYGASFQDLPAIVNLLNQRHICSAAFCIDELQAEWRSGRFNPAMDARLIFDPREYLVGFIQVSLEKRQPLLWGCVHPDYEGRGIGSALLTWGEARVGLELDSQPIRDWSAPHFATLPVERARELCETLGWRQITPPLTEMKRVTGALHLPENANRAVNVFEKAIEC